MCGWKWATPKLLPQYFSYFQQILFYFLDVKPLKLEFVTGGVELLKAVLHGYAGGLLLIIIIVKSLQKEQIAQIT